MLGKVKQRRLRAPRHPPQRGLSHRQVGLGRGGARYWLAGGSVCSQCPTHFQRWPFGVLMLVIVPGRIAHVIVSCSRDDMLEGTAAWRLASRRGTAVVS